jgi:hypothetical protein
VPDAGRGGRAVRPGDGLEVLELADGAYDLDGSAVDQAQA